MAMVLALIRFYMTVFSLLYLLTEARIGLILGWGMIRLGNVGKQSQRTFLKLKTRSDEL
jgi:hypothetical protein